jgi:hypothetical protein
VTARRYRLRRFLRGFWIVVDSATATLFRL